MHSSAEGRRSRALESLLSPYVIFACICLVYTGFPSNHFNADALHYNLLSYLAATDPGALLRDSSVPVHFLWHILATLLLGAVHPENPLHALYVLRVANIALALGSIFLFLLFVRSYAGEMVAAWATLVLAFSHACLQSFLSVEVYSLNNLLLIGALYALHRLSRNGPETLRTRDLLLLAFLTALTIAAHLGNVLLAAATAIFLCTRDLRGGLRRCGIYLAALGALLLAAAGGIAWASSMDPAYAARYFLGFSASGSTYLSVDVAGSLGVAVASFPRAILGRAGLWLYVPLAAAGIFFWRRRARLRGDPWLGFLAIYVSIVALFYSQWDPGNAEHMIAALPALLLLATYAYARTGVHMRGAALAGAALLAAAVAAFGIADDVIPATDASTYAAQRLSSEVRSLTSGSDVFIVGLPSELDGQTIVLASMTFHGQRVVLLDPENPAFPAAAESLRRKGFEELRYDGGSLRR